MAISDVFFFEDKCRFCYSFDSFALLLSLPKVGVFPYKFREIKIKF